MKQVTIEERIEIEGVFCPLSGKKCRIDCRFMIDIEEGCMIEQACRNIEKMSKSLEEMQDQQNQELAAYQD